MKIKGIIFDLDDTLFDCSGQLVASAQRRAVAAMVSAGLPASEEFILQRQFEFGKNSLRVNFFEAICSELGVKDASAEKIVSAAIDAYNSDAVET